MSPSLHLCRHRVLMLTVFILSLIPVSSFSTEYTGLPAAPHAPVEISEATLYLQLVVNGQETHEVVPVAYRQGRFAVEAGVLIRHHVRTGRMQSGLIILDTLPEVKTEYDAADQKLRLTVPDNWLPAQQIDGQSLLSYTQPISSRGGLLNYDVYYFAPYRGSSTLTTWLEQRVFSDEGIFSNTGIWRSVSGGSEINAGRQDYLRYDTWWRSSDEKNMVSWQAGDFISDSLTWSNSVRMGGLRVSRNFSVRPDLVTYPLMQYSGTAAVPGTVDLFINGYKSSSSTVNAGPFTLTNIPYINGAGEATVVTTDAQGRQVTTSVPFYVSNTLLREGLSDFDASFGAVRKNYGVTNADYSDVAFSGLYRYGTRNWLTLSTHVEAMDGLALGGLGSDLAVGRWGTLSSSYSRSHAQVNTDGVQPDGSGIQYTLGYSYSSSRFSLAAQHTRRDSGWQDLTARTGNGHLSRQADQVTFTSSPFGNKNGTLGVGYFDIRAQDATRTRLTSLSYSRALWGNSSLYLSLNKTLGGSGYNSQLQLIVPFSSRITATGSVQKNTRDDYSGRMTVNRTVPVEGGMGWNLAWGDGNSRYRQADITGKTTYTTWQGGVWGDSGQYNHWAGIQGAIIYMDNALFATNRINDAFILVSTDSYDGIPVRYENQLVGKTDKRGHILVPWVSAWYPAKIEIGTLDLPVNTEAPEVEKRVAVREGSGSLVHFAVQKVREASITVTNEEGVPLPVGTPVTELHSGQRTVIGYAGQLWFSHLQQESELIIHLAGGEECRRPFTLAEEGEGITRIGPLTCHIPATTAPESEH